MAISSNKTDSFAITNHRRLFYLILAFSALILFWGFWWGWPTSFDQHDPTRRAIQMLWHRTLDPGVRYWGSFGYPEVLFLSVAPVTLLKKLLMLDQHIAEGLMYLATRVLWAAKALGIVLMAYLMSRELFQDRRAALLSMAMLPLAPGFVAWAHIPQVDLVHCFWYTMAATLTAFAWRRDRSRLLWLAAVAAGFAAGTKYVGGIVVLVPMAACFLRLPFGKALMRSLLLGALALFVFFLTTPLVSGDPVSWLPGYTADVLANNSRDSFRPLAIWTMPGAIWDMIGPGFAVLGIAGVIFAACPGARGGTNAAWLLLLLSIVPYYLIFTTQHVAAVRYMMPISATLIVAIGFLVSRCIEIPPLRKATIGALVLTGLAQAFMVISLETGFSADTRVQLVKWMEQNTEEGDRVETLLNHRPYFNRKSDRFVEVTRPHFQAESYQMHRDMLNDQDSPVRKLHEAMLNFAEIDRSEFVTWVDRERAWLQRRSEEFDTSVRGPAERGTKYVVINVNTAKHYVIDWPGIDPYSPNEKEFYNTLLNGEGPYRLVASFDPTMPEWLRYPKELWRNISPPIRVYEVPSHY